MRDRWVAVPIAAAWQERALVSKRRVSLAVLQRECKGMTTGGQWRALPTYILTPTT